MAKQSSLIKVRGAIGDLSFTKHRTRGYEVQMKGGADKARIMSDPNFQRTRENMAEFGAAVKKSKQLRLQVNNLIRRLADKSMRNRLTSRVHRILKLDDTANRGERVFKDENSGLLRGFEFNERASLDLLFGHEMVPEYARDTGQVSLEIPAFDPQNEVLLLEGATHMQFVLAAARLGDHEVLPRPETQRSEYISLADVYAGTTLQLSLEPDEQEVVYMMVGISMFQRTNEGYYPLHNEIYNALTIVKVDIP